jgi:hypothetical protein
VHLAAFDYYDNNTLSSVTLGWASEHIEIDSDDDCCIVAQKTFVTEGDGNEYLEGSDSVQVDPGEYEIVSNLDLGNQSWSKSGGGYVMVKNSACHLGSCIGGATWEVWFWDDLSITKVKAY